MPGPKRASPRARRTFALFPKSGVRRCLAMMDLLSRVYTLIWVSTIPGEVQSNRNYAATTAQEKTSGCPLEAGTLVRVRWVRFPSDADTSGTQYDHPLRGF